MSVDLQNLNEQLCELQPPSARDRLIFEAVVVKGRSQCELAAEHGISQPRVSQIVAEVGSWLDRSLPRGRPSESTGGEMALGEYVVKAQIDFLLQQTLQDIALSRKDKVTEKSGTRGVVQWTEKKTEGRQIAPVGLLNVASRLALAKAKLAGVDITGRTQRERAMAEERQQQEAKAGSQESGTQESGVRSQESEVRMNEGAKAKMPLIKKIETSAVAAEIVQPQVLAEQEDRLRGQREQFVKNEACKQLINHMQQDPKCAGWTQRQFREHAQFVWDLESSQGDAAGVGEFLSKQASDPHPGPLPGQTSKRNQMSRRRDSRHSPQERRREFLAPLAAG